MIKLFQKASGRVLILLWVTMTFSGAPVWAQGFLQAAQVPLDQIDARMQELNASKGTNLPKNDSLLFIEINKTEDEIGKIISSAQQARDEKSLINDLEGNEKRVANAISGLKVENCAQLTTRSGPIYDTIFPGLDSLQTMIFLNNLSTDSTILAGLNPLGNAPRETPSQACDTLKAIANDAESMKRLAAAFDRVLETIRNRDKANTVYREHAKNLIDLLKAREADLQKQLNSSAPQQQITEFLPWIMAIIGAFSIATILGVKLFADDLQMEWIASGQVIQFVTVMILLSAVMALGLSNRLSENTLGTLLGGIAGYVLAQGVGKAAARDVQRQVAAANALTSTPTTPTPTTPTPTTPTT